MEKSAYLAAKQKKEERMIWLPQLTAFRRCGQKL